MGLDFWGWAMALLGAFLVGTSKTGLPGGVTLAVVLFTQILPAREATGALLPVLIVADIVAVSLLHQHTNWAQLLRLFPWTALGIVLGWLFLGQVNDVQLKRLIGVLIVGIVLYQLVRWVQVHRWQQNLNPPGHFSFALVMGVVAGFTTMIANAAGPFLALYLLAMRLGKLEFVGTAAWFFLVVNLFKVPFASQLGLINPHSLLFNLMLVPAVILGTWAGRWALERINQTQFELLTLTLALVGGVRLVF